MGAIFIRLHRIENLILKDVKNLYDPFVEFNVGNVSKRSTIKLSTQNPVWKPPELFEFIVENPLQEYLNIKVRFDILILLFHKNLSCYFLKLDNRKRI